MPPLLCLFAIPVLTGATSVHAKSASVIVTRAMRANALRNCERYEWARAQRDRLVKRVEPWMAKTDEELWHLLPSQDMPRDSSVNRGQGCPNCGMDHYQAPYSPSRWRWDFAAHPWKVRCANCNEWFPKNDFASYYESALDERGKFHQGKGDPKFLQSGDPAHPDWVDDGTGCVVGEHKWFFAANYAFRLWETLLNVTEDMATLYTLTNDSRYAHKAGVLLDRMADLYPEMDYLPHFRLGMEASTGGSGKGRVQGKIWETWTAQKLSLAYDYVYEALLEDAELVAFSTRMAKRCGTGDKSSAKAIAAHAEEHLLLEFIRGVRDGRIHGNPGMHQYSMAAAAIALDRPGETEKHLDWLFEPNGGQIPFVLVEALGREGFSYESALGYSRIPSMSFFEVAQLLRRYKGYTKHDLYRDYPKFRNCFSMCGKVRALDCYSPNWGDGDKCMNFGKTGLTIPVDMALAGYRVYGGYDIAREVWFANGKRLDGIRGDIYDPEPEALLEKLKRHLDRDPGPLRSYNSGGHGVAVLQAPQRDNGRAFILYYGRMAGHGHEDRLSIVAVANNAVMCPDLGYPLYTGHWPKRVGWTSHVISHNTCMVNDTGPDRSSYSGKTKLFAETGPVRVIDVDGGAIYERVSTYRRCLVMVEVDEQRSYALDLFWVRGGKNHRLIQNGGGPEVTHSGLQLTSQKKGTYAGEDVPFGKFYDGAANWNYDGTGFMYLKDVEKSAEARDFWVDWQIVEPRRTMPDDWEAHLRVHNLTPVDEVGLCTGIPPEYKGNPPALRYLLRTRFGEGLSTQFVSVLEPYAKTPFVKSVHLLPAELPADQFASAVEVSLADGRRDLLLVTENGSEMKAAGATLSGRLGFARFKGDELLTQSLIAGKRFAVGGNDLRLSAPTVTGKLLAWDDSSPADVRLTLDTTPLRETLVGSYLLFDNKERSDASYRIERLVDERTVSIGSNSLVERFVDPSDYEAGASYTISPGDSFAIPLTVSR